MKNEIGIGMGVIIFLADIAWLLYDQSYTVQIWLILAIIILIADLVWIAIDASYMMESRRPPKNTPSGSTPS
jgi:hypothetical protein